MRESVSTRFLLPIAALCALALLAILPRWASPTLIDTCHDPNRFSDVTRIPGSRADYGHRAPDRELRLHDLAGEIDNPVAPSVPIRFRLMRDFDTSMLTVHPAARVEASFEPETAKTRVVTVEGRPAEITLVTGPRSEVIQIGAYVFVTDAGPTSSPIGAQLRHLFTKFTTLRRPTTLIAAHGIAPRSRTGVLEDRLVEWVAGALEHHRESCEGEPSHGR